MRNSAPFAYKKQGVLAINYLEAIELTSDRSIENDMEFPWFWEMHTPKMIENFFTEGIIGELIPDWKASTRRPYYRMRGKPITEEQALEIMTRCEWMNGDIGDINFRQITSNSWPRHGWVMPDGTIGANAIMSKYPTAEEIVEELYRWACEFPYLDLVIAITTIDEYPHSNERNKHTGELMPHVKDYILSEGKEWDDYIDIGVHLKDGSFSMLRKGDARTMYEKYRKMYELPIPRALDPRFDPYDEYFYHNNALLMGYEDSQYDVELHKRMLREYCSGYAKR